MMSSATSTSLGSTGRASGFRARHLYLLLAMAAATWAVLVSDYTHPAALLLLSAAVLAAGVVGAALHEALLGFFGVSEARPVLRQSDREAIETEKKLVLRSIKELEFDHAMRKISDADFAEIGGRLRLRAMSLMADLDRTPEHPTAPPVPPPPAPAAARFCGSCGAERHNEARFCSQCGAKLA